MGVRTITLDPVEISRFLVRQRKDWGIDKLKLRLDTFLATILEKSNEFVPSESGSLLLDDPRAKGREDAINTLTFIACFGPSAQRPWDARSRCTMGSPAASTPRASLTSAKT